MDRYYDESGVIPGKVCPHCGSELIRRKRRAWCDWCLKTIRKPERANQ